MRNSRAMRGAVCAILVGFALGCATFMSTSTEVELGGNFAVEIEAEMGVVEDGPYAVWVREIGARLAKHSSRQDVPYVFKVVDMAEPNAFALPGGYVYVSRGLLALVNDEAELAGVMGHEIGHVVGKHSLRRMSVSTPFAVIFGIPSVIVGMVSSTLGGAIGAIGSVAEGAVAAPYGRSQEHEADQIGQEIAAAAGYDPAGLTRFLQTLDREQKLTAGGAHGWSFFDTHPQTPDRVARTAQLAEELEQAPGTPIASGRTAVFAKLDGLLVGANPAEGVFLEERFLHPDLGFALSFPSGWPGVNGRAGVVAQPPHAADTGIILQIAGEGVEPAAAAVEDGFKADQLERIEVNDLSAVRIVTEQKGARIWITWIGLGDYVYRVVGVTPKNSAERWSATILATHDSFGALDPLEAADVTAQRLRSKGAREGESLEAFSRRTNSIWVANKIAVANALEFDARLEAGDLLKTALAEPYEAER